MLACKVNRVAAIRVQIRHDSSLQEAQFCLYVTRGMTLVAAHEKAFRASRATKASRYQLAYRLYQRVEVKSRIRDKVSDLYSQGECYADLLSDIEASRQSNNMTAVMQGRRLAMSALGMLKERLEVTDSGLSDDALLDRLAGDDPAKRTLLKSILGQDHFAKN